MVRRPNYSNAFDAAPSHDGQSERGLADEYYNSPGQSTQASSGQDVPGYTTISHASNQYPPNYDFSTNPGGYCGDSQTESYHMIPSSSSHLAGPPPAFSGWGDPAYNSGSAYDTSETTHLGPDAFTGGIKTEDLGYGAPLHLAAATDYSTTSHAVPGESLGRQEARAEPWPSSSHHSPTDPYPAANAIDSTVEGDRGFTGALAGGIAGGYAGHKVHHGFLGTLGGAYAGHKLQEAYKDHKHDKPQPQPQPQPQQPFATTSPLPPQDTNPALTPRSFLHTSTNIRLAADGHTLKASSRRVNGSTNSNASIDLNRVLTNDDGRFAWVREGGEFSATAKHAKIVVERGVWLEAELKDCRGRWKSDRVFVGDVVENVDGELGWID